MIHGFTFANVAKLFSRQLFDFRRIVFYTINVLPKRATLLEHLGDVRNHKLLVGGDSLPMHFALGLGVRCVSLFTCTGPWEIHDYGIQEQIASPLLGEYFFKRGFEVHEMPIRFVDRRWGKSKMSGKIMGLVGFGSIAKEVAVRARAPDRAPTSVQSASFDTTHPSG